ncbi:MAG: NAD(P)H-hydrate dehydratase [Ignavibacteria bacterium]|nr:NAD(P)H-hydrate dehydratase [Ignavibacteria bacterium]
MLVTSAEMQACDRFAIETLHISSVTLMENAGRGVVDAMEGHFGPLAGKSVIICCGKGNNGGDGFVAARHLQLRGARVSVILAGKGNELKADAKTNYEILKNIQRKSAAITKLRIIEAPSLRKLEAIPKVDIIVDAIFGTGFSGKVQGYHKKIIEWMNGREEKKVAIDIPSGVNADNGDICTVAPKVDITVTMQMKKVGLVTGNALNYTGAIEVVDIGFSIDVLDLKKVQTYLISSDDVRMVLPHRPLHAHKHSVGKIFVLAGSRGLTGAAAMASSSAMRAGAGAVILGTPASVYPILAKKLTEVMVEPLSDTSEGSVSFGALDQIKKHLQWADVVVVGPGLSRNPDTVKLVHHIVANHEGRILVDADGLNALAENNSILKKHKSKNVIITPHTGELSRLTGIPSAEIDRNRVTVARDVARQFKLTLVLKGAPTVTATPRGNVFVNSTGNPGMATAGSGDVLTGIIAGLWGQGMNLHEAAYAGVYVHGLAGDNARVQFGEKGLLAMDIHDYLPKAFQQLEAGIV